MKFLSLPTMWKLRHYFVTKCLFIVLGIVKIPVRSSLIFSAATALFSYGMGLTWPDITFACLPTLPQEVQAFVIPVRKTLWMPWPRSPCKKKKNSRLRHRLVNVNLQYYRGGSVNTSKQASSAWIALLPYAMQLKASLFLLNPALSKAQGLIDFDIIRFRLFWLIRGKGNVKNKLCLKNKVCLKNWTKWKFLP